jgi:hypothetical protein
MKKRQVKRVIAKTKKGEVPYYYIDGKRVSEKKGRLKWVQQNYDELNKPYAKEQPLLNKREASSLKRSKAQRELLTYKGKKIKRIKSDLLKATANIPKDFKGDIRNIRDDKGKSLYSSYGAFEQAYEQQKKGVTFTYADSLMGASGWRGRTENESALSILESLQFVGSDGWRLEVHKEDGDVANGLENGLEAIREFEEYTTENMQEEVENVAAVSFRYKLNWDFKKKKVVIYLEQTDIEERTSDPLRRLQNPNEPNNQK